jgi:hypothetical protein
MTEKKQIAFRVQKELFELDKKLIESNPLYAPNAIRCAVYELGIKAFQNEPTSTDPRGKKSARK